MIIFPSFGWRVDLMALQHCRQFLFIMGDGQRCVKTKRQIVGRIFNYISWTDDMNEWMNGRKETGRGAGSKRIIFQSQTTTGQKLIACWCRQNYRDSANVLNPRHRCVPQHRGIGKGSCVGWERQFYDWWCDVSLCYGMEKLTIATDFCHIKRLFFGCYKSLLWSFGSPTRGLFLWCRNLLWRPVRDNSSSRVGNVGYLSSGSSSPKLWQMNGIIWTMWVGFYYRTTVCAF